MKIFIINPYVDPAGAGNNLCNAINRLTNHTCEYMVGLKTYFDVDGMCLSQRKDEGLLESSIIEIEKIAERSDILHFNMFDHTSYLKIMVNKTLSENALVVDEIKFNWEELLGRKPFIFHDHGTWMEGRELHSDYVTNKLYNKYDSKYNGVLVCNPFSLGIYNNCKWIQNIIPQDDRLYKPIKKDFDGKILIAHSPSNRRFKGTNMIISVIKKLKEMGYPIDLILAEKTEHNLCMKIKQKCHIVIDSLYDSFPNLASLEGMSQEQVALTRVEEKYMKYYNELGMEMPIEKINNSLELKNKLIDLLENRDKLKETAQKSREWIEKCYADHILIKKWIAYYEEVLEKWQMKQLKCLS
jgi:hypothetical protein